MDSFTVAPELSGTKGDILPARIEVPILAGMIYGIVEFTQLGWSLDHYFYTYAPVLGGVAIGWNAHRRCLNRSLYLFFYCIGEAQKELENSPSPARISSISLFAIRHGSSWPLHNLRRHHWQIFILVNDNWGFLGFSGISSRLSILPDDRDR